MAVYFICAVEDVNYLSKEEVKVDDIRTIDQHHFFATSELDIYALTDRLDEKGFKGFVFEVKDETFDYVLPRYGRSIANWIRSHLTGTPYDSTDI